MKLLFIGDVHGQVNLYWKLLQKYKPDRSIQVGDFGYRKHHEWHRQHLNPRQHKVVFGNHDDPACLTLSHALDWGQDGINHIFWVRGAASTDKPDRIIGLNWWEDEELSADVHPRIRADYLAARPRIVVTHDCPTSIAQTMFGKRNCSRTSQLLQDLLDYQEPHQQPDLWVFGHYHERCEATIGKTRFVCLEELGTLLIDV